MRRGFRRRISNALFNQALRQVRQEQGLPDTRPLNVAAEQARMVRRDFGSIAEFCSVPFTSQSNAARCAEELINAQGTVTYEGRRSGQHSWFGADTGQEAARRVQHGWAEGARKVLQDLASLEVPTPVSVRRRLVRADQGDELDIHAVNRGSLDTAWTRRQRRRATGRLTVRLVVQTNLLASMSAEQLFWRGAAAVKFSDVLTEAGYNVEIVGVLASREIAGMGDSTLVVTFPLKAAQDPLDVEALAGVVCNAGFHRVYGFRCYYALAPSYHSCGSAQSDTPGRLIEAAQLGADNIRTFRVPYEVGSKHAAEQWLTKNIEALDTDAAATASSN